MSQSGLLLLPLLDKDSSGSCCHTCWPRWSHLTQPVRDNVRKQDGGGGYDWEGKERKDNPVETTTTKQWLQMSIKHYLLYLIQMSLLTDINQKTMTLFGRNHAVVKSKIPQKMFWCFTRRPAKACTVLFESLPAEQQLSMEQKPQTYPKTSDWSSSINHGQLESVHGYTVIPTSWWHTPEDSNTLWTHLLHMRGTDLNMISVRLWGWFNLQSQKWKRHQKWSNMAGNSRFLR